MKHNISYLFLRGLTRNQFHWFQKEDYEEMLDGKVYFIDLPGFGEENKLQSPRTIYEIADQVQARWEEIKKRSHISDTEIKVLVGLSLGGLVALELVSRTSEWDKVVTINSSCSDLSKFWNRLKPINYPKLVKAIFLNSFLVVERLIFEMTCNSSDEQLAEYGVQSADLIRAWADLRKKYDFNFSSFLNQLLAASKYKSPKEVFATGLVLTAAKDRLVDFECSKAIASKYNWDIKISKDSGHDISVDAKDWMLREIKEFSLRR